MPATGLAAAPVSQIVLDAVIEVRVGRAADSLEPEVQAWVVRKLNRMFDKWNADPAANYAVGFASYTPTVNVGTRTLGPGGQWVTSQRPDHLKGANVILNTSTPVVRVPITLRDEYWWLKNAVQGVSSAVVTDIYYEADFPLGVVNLWPVPTVAYPIELMTDTPFSTLAVTDTIYLPFGFQEAIVLSLAELIAPGLGQNVSQDLKDAATDARVIVFGNNVTSRNIRTRDGGMPGGRRGGYLYRTGRMKNG